MAREERGSTRRRDEDSGDRGRGSDRGRGDSGRGGRGGSRYQYQPRSAESMRQRGEAGGGDFDKYLDDSVKMFKPNDGDNIIRIMPPTWDKAEHYGLDVFVHYDVGPDSQTYLCPDKMKGDPCPICDERAKATRDGDTEYAEKLKPTKRVLVWMIDRNQEKDGPVVWSMPWTIDRDIVKLVVDKRSGEVLPIDDPQDGYDIEFERKGKGPRTQYIGLAVARRSSDLGDDKWMDYIIDNPLPDLLHYYDYDHVAAAFGGSSGGGARNRDDGRDRDRGRDRDDNRGRDKEDLDARQERELRELESRRGSRGRSSEPELTWEQIHEMTFEELSALIDSKDLTIRPDESKDDEELADWVCEDLKITKAVARRRAEISDSASDKMNEMRRRRG